MKIDLTGLSFSLMITVLNLQNISISCILLILKCKKENLILRTMLKFSKPLLSCQWSRISFTIMSYWVTSLIYFNAEFKKLLSIIMQNNSFQIIFIKSDMIYFLSLIEAFDLYETILEYYTNHSQFYRLLISPKHMLHRYLNNG